MTDSKDTLTINRGSMKIVATITCAVLYAVGAYLTAYIPSPWGFGQFRPAVVIPAFFAVIFGPLPSGLGAALGTLIADSVKHGYLYPGSLIAAVPGNFIGFYIFGWICRRFSWARFIAATNITLISANFIVAFLYLYVYKFLYLSALPLSFTDIILLSAGLTVWWFVTMLPFILIVTPILIKAVSVSIPTIVPESVRVRSVRMDLPDTGLSLSMIIPGIILLTIGLITNFTEAGRFLIHINRLPSLTPLTGLLYGSGATLLILGAYHLIHKSRK